MHIDDLIGYLTARRREYRAAVALIVVDPEQSRITAHDIIVKCLSLPRLVKAVAIRRQRLEPSPIIPPETAAHFAAFSFPHRAAFFESQASHSGQTGLAECGVI